MGSVPFIRPLVTELVERRGGEQHLQVGVVGSRELQRVDVDVRVAQRDRARARSGPARAPARSFWLLRNPSIDSKLAVKLPLALTRVDCAPSPSSTGPAERLPCVPATFTCEGERLRGQIRLRLQVSASFSPIQVKSRFWKPHRQRQLRGRGEPSALDPASTISPAVSDSARHDQARLLPDFHPVSGSGGKRGLAVARPQCSTGRVNQRGTKSMQPVRRAAGRPGCAGPMS